MFSVRTPDSVTAIYVDGETYIATANEGDDLEYGDFEEKLKAKDIFDGAELGLAGASSDPSIFDPSSPMSGQSKYFNGECGDMEGSPDWCASSMRFTIGSSMVDYSDPAAPMIKKLVGESGFILWAHKMYSCMRNTNCSLSLLCSRTSLPYLLCAAIGGRGISIFKLSESGLDLVWDSADEFEREGCKAFPWAHNGIQVSSCCVTMFYLYSSS